MDMIITCMQADPNDQTTLLTPIELFLRLEYSLVLPPAIFHTLPSTLALHKCDET